MNLAGAWVGFCNAWVNLTKAWVGFCKAWVNLSKAWVGFCKAWVNLAEALASFCKGMNLILSVIHLAEEEGCGGGGLRRPDAKN